MNTQDIQQVWTIQHQQPGYIHAEVPNGTPIPARTTVDGVVYRLDLAGQVYHDRVTTYWYADSVDEIAVVV